MAVVINTNVDSLKIQNCLNVATRDMSKVMQRMSTGLKVNSAKDDAAGCVIAAKMQVQLNGNQIAQANIQNGNAMLSTAEGNLDVIEENLVRIRDLTLQAKNGTYSATEKDAMQQEVEQRAAEITRISDSAKYSSSQLFGGALATSGITFQVGADAANTIAVSATNDGKGIFESATFTSLTGITGAVDTAFNIGTMTDFSGAITKLDDAIDKVTARKAKIGALGNRFDSALSTLATQYENLSSAKSVITDADVANEASKYTQHSILQQVSTSLLTQANQAPSIALSLL